MLNVIVWFGSAEPNDDMIDHADEELARLAVPGA
jgi:hypothetical protein